MPSIQVPVALYKYLAAAAERSNTNVASILERTLNARPLGKHPQAKEILSKLSPTASKVADEVDWMLRVANPGSQLVIRSEYIGYRRFDKRQPSGTLASRSQIYISLLPRKTFVRLVFPLSVQDFRHVDGVIDLSRKGHHGVGNMAIDVDGVDQARAVFANLEEWLGPT